MNLRILQYSDMDPSTWDKFVYSNKGGWAYYLYDVIAMDRWINDKNMSFCVWDDSSNAIMLIAQLHIEKGTVMQENIIVYTLAGVLLLKTI